MGLRRAGFEKDVIKEIKWAFKLIYRSNLNTNQAIEKIMKQRCGKEVMQFVEFIKSSKRGICKYIYSRDDRVFFKENNGERGGE